jgi:integrative and conjugative element protein (TIGR02256 family)
LIYPVSNSGQRVVFSDQVLAHFSKHRQVRWWQREAGGQLFARFDLPNISIVEATGPRPGDRRSRYGYRPDRSAERREIADRHAHGVHFIGDWHTHPEDMPTPSGPDEESTRESFVQSGHSLNAFLLVIVGRLPPPEGLALWIYNGSSRLRLSSSGQPPSEIRKQVRAIRWI